MLAVALLLIVVLLFARVPVAFAMLAGTFVYYLFSPMPIEIAAQRLYGGLSVFTLLAIPMFILVGSIMARGGVAEALYGFANSLVGHVRGGLAQVNVLNSVVMGGMSGSAIADASVDSRVLVPVMERHGYSRAFSTAISAASGIIAPILPPGVGMIVYGLVTQGSVGRLFLGGMVPALLLAVTMSTVVAVISRRRGFSAAFPKQKAKQRARAFVYAVPALLMPVILIVGLRGGVFTPTELSVFAVGYVALVALFIYRKMKPSDMYGALVEAVETSASVMILVGAGLAFGSVLSLERVPQTITSTLSSIDNGILVLIVVNVALLLLGMVVDGLTCVVLFAPAIAAAGAALGFDPTHIGVMVVLNLTIAGITPPLGVVVLASAQITKVKPAEAFKECLPFTLSAIVVLVIVMFVPPVVTAIPTLIYGS